MNQNLNCVLVIDDDEPTNFFTQIILEDYGCTNHIRVMQSGQDALDYLAKSEQAGCDANLYPSPNLILLDINMPAMDGWEFLDEYKKLNVANRIIVVMLTTSLFPEDMTRAEAIPEISGFENKPLTAEKLENILRKHFATGKEEQKTRAIV
jgi:CheY-like chemotaxis protein